MPALSGQPRLLIVDDERVIADTLALILGKEGFAVKVAYDGEEALRLAEMEPPDIVISDLLLSGMDGARTAVEIRKFAPNCRVYLISGQMLSQKQLQESHADAQGFEILLKPVHPQKLVQKLKEGSAEA